MIITFLGTSSGAPSRQRNVSATAIQPERGKHWLLVDCGEATQHQLLRTKLSPQKLSTILITHIHGDHCYGLPGLLASCQLSGRTEPLILVGPQPVWDYLQAVILHTQLQITYPLEFIPVGESLALTAAGFNISAHPLSHRVPSWGYRFEEANIPNRLDVERLQAEGVGSGPHYGLLQKGIDVVLPDGRPLKSVDYCQPSYPARVAVIGGDNDLPELLSDACQGSHVLVHEATYTEDILQQVGPEPQHSCAAQVANFAERNGVPSLILTHFSPRYQMQARKTRERSMDEIEAEARSCYRGKLFLAQDFDRYQIDRNGQVSLIRGES